MIFYIIILLFCCGTYQLLCYLFMHSTSMSGRMILTTCASKKYCFLDVITLLIADRIAKKWEFHIINAETIESHLRENGIYMGGTVFLVSRILMLVIGLFLCLPKLFINKMIFLLLCCLWSSYSLIVFIRLYKAVSIREELKYLIEKIGCQLLLGAFFIAQIFLLLKMLT